METVTIYRGETAIDADGNEIQGQLKAVHSLSALVAPVTETDTVTNQSTGVLTGYTLYVRGEPTEVTDTDVIDVRGQRLPVAGRPAVWQDTTGTHIGDVITVKLKEG